MKGDFGSYPGLLLFRLDSVTFQYPFIGDAINKILFLSHYVEVQIPSMVSLFSLPMTKVIQAHRDSGYLESMCPSSSMFSKHHTAEISPSLLVPRPPALLLSAFFQVTTDRLVVVL